MSIQKATSDQRKFLLEKLQNARFTLIDTNDPNIKLGTKGTLIGFDDDSAIIDWDSNSISYDLSKTDSGEKEDISMKAFIESLTEKQSEGKLLPCPRCGKNQMRLPVTHNAWSRYADIYVCVSCGLDESLRDATKKDSLPFEEWFVAFEDWDTEYD